MLYSDLKILPDLKIEILPTDRVCESRDVLIKYDRIICVFRGINGNLIADKLKEYFIEEFKFNFIHGKQTPDKTLYDTVKAFHFSMLHPPADFEPKDKVSLIVVYIANNTFEIVRQGDMTIKKKINGRYEEIITRTTIRENEIVTS